MKKRVISAAILFAIFIPLIIIGGIPFRIATAIIAILAYKEILSLKGIKSYPLGVVIIGLVTLLVLTFSNRDTVLSIIGLNYRYIAFAFLAMFLPVIFYYNSGKYTATDAFRLTSFIMYVGLFLNILQNILIYSRGYFIMLLLITILTDTFAYFTGMAIGKHKFTPISPNKTIEGCIGGVVMGTALTSIYYVTFIGAAPLWRVIPALFILTVVCELGDLFFSALKREYKIKDFSNLIPGHGGVLDRFDSLSFVTLMFVLLSGII